MRLLPLLRHRFRVFALTRDTEDCPALHAAGAVPVIADLDDRHALARAGRLARIIVHLAPPQAEGIRDQRTRNLISALPDGTMLIYVSTTGVYGDCGGAKFDETRPIHPKNVRAKRRADAERVLRAWGRHNSNRAVILRVPGIYAADRLPTERLQKQLPALIDSDDVYTNHIHADDLAHLIALAIFRARSNRIYHASDDSELKMGEYFDIVADAIQLPRPPRLPRAELQSAVSPMMFSFMSESRRLVNTRIKYELRTSLQFPTVSSFFLRTRIPI